MLKKLSILIFTFFLFVSNAKELNTATLDEISKSYTSLIEQNFANRAFVIKEFDSLKNSNPFTGADHEVISKILTNHLTTKDRLEYFIQKYQYLVDNSDGYSDKDRMLQVMISLSAMLVRYDNYLLAYSNYEDDKRLRNRLNEADYNIPKNTLKDITSTYNSYFNRRDVKKLIKFYKDNIDKFANNKDRFFNYTKALIEQSLSYQIGFNSSDYLLSNTKTLYSGFIDKTIFGSSTLTYQISKAFGNSVGLVETRKGKLYDNDEITKHISSNLKAGDILLEKTPFRLTDKLIPGYWGHAAIYVGTKDELKELGIWDNEAIKPYHKDIEDGKVIIEALRDGVVINSVAHFLNIDSFASMQNLKESRQNKAKRIIRAFKQLGKEYDFNFDIETADKIVCSELIYITSIYTNWETEKLVGIATISPDNVAKKSIEDKSKYKITLLYSDGDEITDDKKEVMKLLLESEEE